MHNVVSLEERNGRCFDGEKQDLTKLKFLLLRPFMNGLLPPANFQ